MLEREVLGIRIYLLDLKELRQEGAEELLSACLDQLDEVRRHRVEQGRTLEKRTEAIGAGLLLQLAVRDWMEAGVAQTEGVEAALEEEQVIRQTPSGILARLESYEERLSLTYVYGKQGKPYLKEFPLFFSLSHSGSYVLCAVAEQELGADIQEKKLPLRLQIAKRYFAPKELETLQELCLVYGVDQDGRTEQPQIVDWFYHLWCRKEAWGKLTGQGVAGVLGQSCEEATELSWKDIAAWDGYQVSICMYKREQRLV